MSLENLTNGKDGQMEIEEAHKEANMMRAKLDMNSYTGKIPTTEFERIMNDSEYSLGGREPTAEDYDAALAAIEELGELAREETVSEKIRDIFGRLSANSAMAGWTFLWAIMGIGNVMKNDLETVKDVADLIKGVKLNEVVEASHERNADRMKKTNETVFSKIDSLESWKTRFEGAAYQLRQLRKRAEKYNNI